MTTYFSCTAVLFFSETKPAEKGEESVALVVALMTGLFLNHSGTLKRGASKVYLKLYCH